MSEELTDEQLASLHRALLDVQKSLSATMHHTDDAAQAVDLDTPQGRLSRMDAMQQQAMATEQRRRAELRIKQVSAALKRIEDGDYGYCRTCEEPIDYKRLIASPETPFCVPCMSRMERRG